jgi:hypothetical protein
MPPADEESTNSCGLHTSHLQGRKELAGTPNVQPCVRRITWLLLCLWIPRRRYRTGTRARRRDSSGQSRNSGDSLGCHGLGWGYCCAGASVVRQGWAANSPKRCQSRGSGERSISNSAPRRKNPPRGKLRHALVKTEFVCLRGVCIVDEGDGLEGARSLERKAVREVGRRRCQDGEGRMLVCSWPRVGSFGRVLNHRAG